MAAMTLSALARQMALAAASAARGEARGLKAAGQMLEEEARASLGTYQAAAAPFPRWADLKDATIADRLRHGFSANEPLKRSGDLRDTIHHEVKGRTVHVFTRSPIAPHHEFGTRRMAPRPFLGPAVVRNLDRAGDAIAREVLTPFFTRRT
ncbi:phage virion morphogenesis protein [Roseomonas sp. CCTCC AB2023176]|uniref:phage virion morphogenesis protein n=1 Tax=Roseomonas sp. CCTCC AB2023176 TaxID=3342640 RepID=UPI0035E168E3